MEVAVHDYQEALNDIGISESSVRAMSEKTDDLLLDEQEGIQIKDSPIQGKGAFATKDYPIKARIGQARLLNQRTLLNRYTNHSASPNAVPIMTDVGVDLFAIKPIQEGDEITVDYRHAWCAHSEANRRFRPIRKGEIAETLHHLLQEGANSGDLQTIPDQIENFHPDGLYGRKQTLPATAVVVGRVHKRESLTILLYGELIIVNEDGERQHHISPDIWITKPGTQRVIYAMKDSAWIGVWPTNKTDMQEIEDELTCMSMNEYLSLEAPKCSE
jgi:hypothetical protein